VVVFQRSCEAEGDGLLFNGQKVTSLPKQKDTDLQPAAVRRSPATWMFTERKRVPTGFADDATESPRYSGSRPSGRRALMLLMRTRQEKDTSRQLPIKMNILQEGVQQPQTIAIERLDQRLSSENGSTRYFSTPTRFRIQSDPSYRTDLRI
jgi:hypothetical protein